ncbi:unnamed protein product [Ambrosiozyma monospora]|uniref:Unnamed protein product n=1 Tax=Ambrosiozyma monospora TaxID=43982 RepID=A0ACB5U1P2_AMBMO|nr:unnamed protein product [Ambrosiozyma monospora]
MPAVWLLNAKIPRTAQYGSDDCSCWSTGCGEVDLFEILDGDKDKLICHVHEGSGTSSSGGGSQDYFERPTSGSFKGAAIFENDTLYVVQLDDDTDFSSGLSSSDVSSWADKASSSATLSN